MIELDEELLRDPRERPYQAFTLERHGHCHGPAAVAAGCERKCSTSQQTACSAPPAATASTPDREIGRPSVAAFIVCHPHLPSETPRQAGCERSPAAVPR